jgi:succinate dehydrogenase (ubiquinone) membrane anchor subunit
LFNFDKASGQREALHFTSYALAFGVPAALLIGPPVSTVVDLAMGIVVPLHSHLGMRSVIVDYVHDVTTQRVALLVLAVTTAGMAVGLTMFSLTDVGLTGAIKGLWVRQDAGLLAGKKAVSH